MARLLRILLPPLGFFALAVGCSFPLVLHLTDRIPGDMAGDNVTFLWNLWWMRQSGVHFFFTPLLFAPFGTDLALHTHTALQGVVAATVLRALDIVLAQNIIILASLTLNGVAAYALALDRTKDRAAAVLAGVLFSCSPFIAAHLLGHFNLISAWTLPLFLLCFLRSVERRSFQWSVATGLCLVAVTYSDYYYAVYCAVLALGALIWRSGIASLACRPRPLGLTWTAGLGAALIGTTALALSIAITGGFDVTIGGVRIVATQPGNLLTASWLLLAAGAWLRLRPLVTLHPASALPTLHADLGVLAPAIVISGVGILPLAWHVLALLRAGDYSAPVHFWRSGPAGIDVLTLVLGNPFHGISGGWTTAAYTRFGIDRIESLGWLGIVPTACLVWGILQWRRRPAVRAAVSCGAFFFVWALGPWLTIAGFNTGLILPANVFGLVPMLSNARMPGRAIVVVVLCAALLAARLLAATSPGRRRQLAAVMTTILLLDSAPAPFPLARVDVPTIYTAIPSTTGAVLELPMGLRDGFEKIGAFDEHALLHQIIHGHPLVGGFLARIPPSIKRQYADLEVVRSLLGMSDGSLDTALPTDAALTRDAAGMSLRQATVRFIVLDRSHATPQLTAYVESALPLQLLATEGALDLLEVCATAGTARAAAEETLAYRC